MKWNDGKERAKFMREQAKLRKEYLAAGMTEEQIQKMFEFDFSLYKKRRNEAIHTQSFDFERFDENVSDEGKNPLLDKFTEDLTVEIDYSQSTRFGWVEEIENPKLIQAIRELDKYELEILTEMVIDGFTQTEIAEAKGVSQQSISKKFMKVKRIFEKWL